MELLSQFTMETGDGDLKDLTFSFIIKVLGFRNQVQMNHWQTTSYAEHKLLDQIQDALNSHVDRLAESAIGIFERPQINTVSLNLSDNRMCPTKRLLEDLAKELDALTDEYKVTSHEGMVTILGDFQADVNKFKYLSTLE